mgnify:CR=1 FL=1
MDELKRFSMGGMDLPVDELIIIKGHYISLLSKWVGFGSHCTISEINRVVLGLKDEEKDLLIAFIISHKELDSCTKETGYKSYEAVVKNLMRMHNTSRYVVDQGGSLAPREDKKEC